MKKILYNIFILGLITLLTACSPSVPKDSTDANKAPDIYPDYTEIIIPQNIAPLNFAINEEGEDFVLKVNYGDKSEVFSANSEKHIIFDLGTWKKMTEYAAGKSLDYELYAKNKNKWTKYTFKQNIVTDSIDKYLTYRLIEPLYKQIGSMEIYQYDIETSKKKVIFDYRKNDISRDYEHTYCMNCHTTQKSNPKNRFFYVRGTRGGMVLTYNGETKVVNTKCGDMNYSTGHGSWHPALPYIACTSENVRQSFPSNDNKKIYQFDTYGDIVLYDAEKNEITSVFKTKNRTEGLVKWSPDGEYLYYCYTDSINTDHNNATSQRYDIARVKFNAQDKSFGESEIIFRASAKDSSAASPCINADGKHMMFRMGKYGMYMQTNKTCDIYMMDLDTRKYYPLDSLNSPEADNFHDFSSNGRWILYESKKEDGNYGRVYFSYFDKNGIAHKPFAIPHEYPMWDKELMKCYNCTEFTTYPNEMTSKEYHKILEEEKVLQATYGSPIDSASINGTSGASKVDAVGGASNLNKKNKQSK